MDWQYALDATYPDRRVPKTIPPWDHLREKRFPVDTYLNGLRLGDYQTVFDKHTVVLDEQLAKEGEDMLDLAPASLLEKYSREDLTTSVVMFTIRKKG